MAENKYKYINCAPSFCTSKSMNLTRRKLNDSVNAIAHMPIKLNETNNMENNLIFSMRDFFLLRLPQSFSLFELRRKTIVFYENSTLFEIFFISKQTK